MVGLPKELKTKQDWLNAVSYALSTGDGKTVIRNRLLELRSNVTVLVLKEANIDKPPEDQKEDDFERVDDPACEKVRLGFTDTEIEHLIGELQ